MQTHISIASTNASSVSGLIDCVASHLEPFVAPAEGRTVAEKISSIIFGTGKSRIGKAPTPDQQSFMVKLIDRFVKVGAPIEMLGMWSAVKGFGLDRTRFGVDVMDLISLRRFTSVADQVQSVYEPGMNIRLVREDIGERVLTGEPDTLDEQIAAYSGELDCLVNMLGISESVSFDDESRILIERGATPDEFLALGREFTTKLVSYWFASDSLPEDAHYAMPEFQELEAAMGWRGALDQSMRDYYLSRAGNSYPSMTKPQLAEMVCTYLGYAKARGRFDFFRGTFEDGEGAISPVRVSLVPYPKGTDASMMMGRVVYKVKDSRNSNNTIAPWCGFGAANRKDDGHYNPSIYRTSECRDAWAETELRLDGPNGSSIIRCDICEAA
tara:strand:+ start:160978 stop:162129 length:1152 start_codon:yes stop_codon:yes gene_type:complete